MMRWGGGLVATAMLTFLGGGDARAEDGVLVHLRRPDMKLEMRGRYRKWTAGCDAPCDERFDPKGLYRVRGGGMRGTEDVDLADARADAIDIGIDEQHSTKPSAGRKILIGGVLTTVTSIGVFVAGVFVLRSADLGCYGPCDTRGGIGLLMVSVGAGGFVAGTVISAVGGLIWALAPSTTPQPAVYPRAPAPPPVAPIVSFAW